MYTYMTTLEPGEFKFCLHLNTKCGNKNIEIFQKNYGFWSFSSCNHNYVTYVINRLYFFTQLRFKTLNNHNGCTFVDVVLLKLTTVSLDPINQLFMTHKLFSTHLYYYTTHRKMTFPSYETLFISFLTEWYGVYF